MKTAFARALLGLTLVTLPASALASTKGDAKADKAKHSHSHASVAKKEPKTKKAKHHGHKPKHGESVASPAVAAPGASKAP